MQLIGDSFSSLSVKFVLRTFRIRFEKKIALVVHGNAFPFVYY